MIKEEEKLKESGLNFIKLEDRIVHFSDNDGYKYTTNKYKILRNGGNTSHKYRNTNPYKFENMELTLRKNNPYNSKIIYDSYKGSTRDRMDFICGNCGSKFKLGLHDFFTSDYRVCGDCYRKVQNSNISDIFEVRTEILNLGFIPIFEKFKGVNSPLEIMDYDGYKGYMNLGTLRRGCEISKFATYNPFNVENLRLYCKKNNIKVKISDQKIKNLKGTKNNIVKVICACGEEFELDVYKFTNGQDRCKVCSKSQSSYETKVERFLNTIKGLNYKKQYKFKDCKAKATLPFDFYIENIGLIEVDGEGHYHSVRFNGMNKEEAERRFQISKNNDEIKTNYCKDNNIKLLRIPYWEFDEKDTYKEKINQWLR